MATREEMQEIAKAAVEQYIKSSEGDVTKGNISESELLKELNNHVKQVEKTVLNQAKQNIRDNTNRDKLIQKLTSNVVTKLEKQGVIPGQPKEGFFQRATNFLAGGEASKDSFEQMYRVRQRFSGIEQIFAGNFKSGITQVAGSFTNLARIMNGPYVAALTTVVAGLNAFDKYLAKLNSETFTATGGYLSPYRSASYSEIQGFRNRNREALGKIQLRDSYDDIRNSIVQNFSTKRRQSNFDELVNAYGYGRRSFESLGIDAATSDKFMNTLMRNEGLNANQSLVAMKRIQNRTINASGLMSDKQIIDETMKGYDANKKFNLSMDWVNRQVVKFNTALEKGTRSMDDFAAVQKSFYGGDTGQLAGMANIIAESAGMAGVEVPSELLQNLNNPFALKMLMSDPAIMKKLGPGLQATAKRMAAESGQAGNTLAEQGFLGDMLQQLFKVNVSRGAIIDLQKSGYDFEKAGLLGTGGGISASKREQDQKDINEQAQDFRNDMINYTKRTTTIAEQISTKLGEIKDQLVEEYSKNQEQRIKEDQRVGQVLMSDNVSGFEKFMISLGQGAKKGVPGGIY